MALQTKAAYGALESDAVTPIQHPVELDRNLLEALFGPNGGASRIAGFALTPTGTNQQLSIAQGFMYLLGRENAQQGGYFAWSDAAETKNFGAPSGSPRIDTLLMRVYDPQYGTLPSGSYRVQWDVVAGTPAATPAARPDSDFLSAGSQYVPGAWIKWAEVRINPGDTVIPSGQIYQPGSVVSGVGTTWASPYSRAAGISTPTIYPSGVAPANFGAGDLIHNVSDGYRYFWTGSAFKDPYARGVIGGARFTNTGAAWNTVTGTEAVLTSAGGNFTSGNVNLAAGRRYRVTAAIKSAQAATSQTLVTHLRETNVSGNIITEDVRTVTSLGQTWEMFAEFDNSTARTISYVVCMNTGGGNATTFAGSSSSDCFIEVEDIGPSGVVAVRAWP